MGKLVQYAGGISADTGRNPSAGIWGDLPNQEELRNGPRAGIEFFDDFVNFMPHGTQTTHLNLGQYNVFCSTAGNIIPTTTPLGGAALTGGHISALADTAGDAFSLALNHDPFVLNSGKLWFEARIGMTGIATNNEQVFVGLGETAAFTALSATVPLGDTDTANTSGCMIGFNVKEDGLGVLNTCYQDRSATWTYVKTGTSGTMAANTYIKVGFVYNPNDSTNAIKFYVNGVALPDVVSASTLAALTYLDVNGLGPVMAGFADTAGTTNYVYMDWWRCAQVISGL